jgi:2-oxoglutarate dehydrogenase E2 component (dihydrolipoamide succinyltransferase)
VVTVAECDLFKASKLREANKDRYKKEGMSLTMLAFLVVGVARALRENPGLNARVLDDAYSLGTGTCRKRSHCQHPHPLG